MAHIESDQAFRQGKGFTYWYITDGEKIHHHKDDKWRKKRLMEVTTYWYITQQAAETALVKINSMAYQHNRDFNEAAARVAKKPETFDAEWQKLYDKWGQGEGYSLRDLRFRVSGSTEQAPDYTQPAWTAPYFVTWRDDRPGELTRYCFTLEEAQAISNGTIYHNNSEKTLWAST
jgi:hypothetical protein